jgi:serine/threonine-protein kinase
LPLGHEAPQLDNFVVTVRPRPVTVNIPSVAHSEPPRIADLAHSADRNLLFGILALQMDFITRDALIAAMNSWVLQKEKPLADLLEEQGALTPMDRSLLEPLVRRHVEQHGNDPSRSLASLSSVDWIRPAIASLGATDTEVLKSLNGLHRQPQDIDDSPHEDTSSPGSTSRVGPRFRILRFHARGGLGEVFVAEDVELHREVALKQIQDRYIGQPDSQSRFLLEAEITGGLEHPGIVPVYGLGHNDDGRPFYAMRFIKGDSLREAIARFHGDETAGRNPGERMLELQKLLRRFLDVCNAIAYAHSRGVLHRDIKPGNIMVGQFGETLLVDWGLAKVVGTNERTGEATLRPPAASGSSETLPGAAVGTPAYMSPEQAAGRLDDLGPATDVYSLGATLYCLLTGKSPAESSDAADVDAVLKRVQKGDIRRPRQVKPDTPTALEAVCLKAMALDPADRYGSPRELADDIERWLADEPVAAWREPISVRGRRWMRHHRTAVAAATATVLMGLLGLGIAYSLQSAFNRELRATNLRLVAANAQVTKAKAESDRRLDQTLQAIEDYYTGVGEEVLLGEEGFQELRQRLLEKPRRFYEDMAAELRSGSTNDERGKFLLAKGNLGLGSIFLTLDLGADAEQQFRAAVELFRNLLARNSANQQYQSGLARGRERLGAVQYDRGEFEPCVESYQQAILVYEKLVAERPADRSFRNGLAKAFGNLGLAIQKLGDYPHAEEYCRRALAIFEELGPANDDDVAYEKGLALTHSNLAEVMSNGGNFAGAVETLQKAIAVISKVVAVQPANLDFQYLLVQTYDKLSMVRKHLKDVVGAIETSRKALAIITRLVSKRPNVATYQYDLAGCHDSLGQLLCAAGDHRSACDEYRQTISTCKSLFASHPDVPSYQERLIVGYNNLSVEQCEIGEPKQAEETIRVAIEMATQHAEAFPRVPYYRSALACCHATLAEALEAQGRQKEAELANRQAIKLQQLAFEQSPKSEQALRLLRSHHAALARTLLAQSRPVEAAEATRQHISLSTGDRNELYNASGSLALCVPLCDDPTVKRGLAAESIGALRAAIAAGWSDAAAISRDPRLAPLRDREDFRQLIAELLDRAFPPEPFAL